MSKFKQPNPDRPKPPMTAFLAWFSPRKEKFKTDFPEMSYAQLCKKACERIKIWCTNIMQLDQNKFAHVLLSAISVLIKQIE